MFLNTEFAYADTSIKLAEDCMRRGQLAPALRNLLSAERHLGALLVLVDQMVEGFPQNKESMNVAYRLRQVRGLAEDLIKRLNRKPKMPAGKKR